MALEAAYLKWINSGRPHGWRPARILILEFLMRQVEIRLEGYLDKKWLDWLEGVTIVHTAQNQTILSGSVWDQAALYGLIIKLRDLGVKLVSVNYGDILTEEISIRGIKE